MRVGVCVCEFVRARPSVRMRVFMRVCVRFFALRCSEECLGEMFSLSDEVASRPPSHPRDYSSTLSGPPSPPSAADVSH